MITAALLVSGTLIGVFVTRVASVELERWRRREETMRMLRWAVEFATDKRPRRRRAGIAALDALVESPLLDKADERLVNSISQASIREIPFNSEGGA